MIDAAQSAVRETHPPLPAELWNPRRAIGGARFDAFLLWGAPLLAAGLIWAWVDMATVLPQLAGEVAVAMMVALVGMLTFAHLIAVVPRAYLNPDVFAANRRRLTVVPALLVAALFASPGLLIVGGVVAIFWDVHHSAMQTFGLARIYDAKAGADPRRLRLTDMVLNWILYVGPIAAGASLNAHVETFARLAATPLALLASAPAVVDGLSGPIRNTALAVWAAGVLLALIAYATERGRGYRMPAHKGALLLSTATVSILAWALSPPFVAFAIVNLFHAVQYFALVWLKEGGRMHGRLRAGVPRRAALLAFILICALFGLAYAAAERADLLLAPFIACSLLHFWFDSFIWSVRKRQA